MITEALAESLATSGVSTESIDRGLIRTYLSHTRLGASIVAVGLVLPAITIWLG